MQIVLFGRGEMRPEYVLGRRGQRLDIFVLFWLKGKQKLDLRLRLEHKARETTGLAWVRGVVQDRGEANITGQVKIGALATDSDSFLRMNVVTLGPAAKAQVSPQMEILTNDIQAAHAATVGRFGDEEMFYLASRGLAEKPAKELLVSGFFRPVLERIRDRRVRLAIMGGVGLD